MADPQFAEGTNPEQARQGLQSLQEQGWVLDEDGQGVKKTYYFKSYFKAVVCWPPPPLFPGPPSIC